MVRIGGGALVRGASAVSWLGARAEIKLKFYSYMVFTAKSCFAEVRRVRKAKSERRMAGSEDDVEALLLAAEGGRRRTRGCRLSTK